MNVPPRKVIQIELPVNLSDQVEAMSEQLELSTSAVIEQLLFFCFDEHSQDDLLELVRLLDADTNFAEVA